MAKHVVVAGGGIAGTAAALALRRAGIEATVIEARPAEADGGAVVRLNPNGMDALRAIGAHQAIIAVSFPLLRSEFFNASGSRVRCRVAADPTSDRGMPRVLAWSQLSSTLRAEAMGEGAVFRHATRVAAVEESVDGVLVRLDDGTGVHADLLVGADGARSAVRTLIDPQAPQPVHIGTRTVYGYTPQPPSEPPPPEVLRGYGAGRAFLAVTRNSFTGGCFFFTSLRAPQPLEDGAAEDTERWRAELLEVFAEQPSIAAIVRGADRVLAFDDYAMPHLPRWHTDRMIVIGDAVHVAPPASEQGAAIAVEDGVLLAQCLRDIAETRDALTAFEKLRRERVEAVVALGQAGTTRAHTRGPRRLSRQAKERLTKLAFWRPAPTGGPAWAFNHHIDWERTIQP